MSGTPERPDEPSATEQAADWLVRLRATHFLPDDPYRDPAARNAAFFAWIEQSPQNLILFLEFVEIEHRLRRLDAAALAEIRSLLADTSQS